MLESIAPFLGIIQVACKDYNVPVISLLAGIFWVMSKTRTDFLLFKQSIENRMANFEEEQERQGRTIQSHDTILNRHETELALIGRDLVNIEDQ